MDEIQQFREHTLPEATPAFSSLLALPVIVIELTLPTEQASQTTVVSSTPTRLIISLWPGVSPIWGQSKHFKAGPCHLSLRGHSFRLHKERRRKANSFLPQSETSITVTKSNPNPLFKKSLVVYYAKSIPLSSISYGFHNGVWK